MAAVTHLTGGDILNDAFVRCRTYNHAWDEFTPIDFGAPSFGWRLSLRCVRCYTERHDNCDYSGRLMSRRYIYPEGYRMTRDATPSREVFREELFNRLRAKLEADHAVGEVVPIKAAKKAAKSTRRPQKAR